MPLHLEPWSSPAAPAHCAMLPSLPSCSDLIKVQDGIGDKFSIFLQLTATFFIAFIIGFAIEPYLTLFMLGLTPILAVSAFVFTKVSSHPHITHQASALAQTTWIEFLAPPPSPSLPLPSLPPSPPSLPPSLCAAAHCVLQSRTEAVCQGRCCG